MGVSLSGSSSAQQGEAVSHRILCQRAEKAIEDVFSDTTVSAVMTKASLSDLRDNISNKIQCIEQDLKIANRGRDGV